MQSRHIPVELSLIAHKSVWGNAKLSGGFFQLLFDGFDDIGLDDVIGADIIKIYPVDFYGGPRYLKALKGPLPFIKLMAAGEIPLESAFDYLKYACAVAIHRPIFDKTLIRSHNWQEITERARQLTQKLESLKVPKN